MRYRKTEKVINTLNKLDKVRGDKEKMSKQDFVEKSSVDVNKIKRENERQKFLDKLEKNPELLQNFNLEQLEKIRDYLIEDNERLRKKLKKS